MLSRLLRVPNCGQLYFAASCGLCDLPQLMHACHCGHINSAPSAMLRPRVPVAAAGPLQHGGSVHISSTVRFASASKSAQLDSRRTTGCRTAYRQSAAAAMHNTVRGGLCKGAPLDTTLRSTTNIRWSSPHARACSALILATRAWPGHIMSAVAGRLLIFCVSEAAAGSPSAGSRSPSRSRCTLARRSAARRSLRRWRSSWGRSASHAWTRYFRPLLLADDATSPMLDQVVDDRIAAAEEPITSCIPDPWLMPELLCRWPPTGPSMCCRSWRGCMTWATWRLLPAAPTVRHLLQGLCVAWCDPAGLQRLQDLHQVRIKRCSHCNVVAVLHCSAGHGGPAHHQLWVRPHACRIPCRGAAACFGGPCM